MWYVLMYICSKYFYVYKYLDVYICVLLVLHVASICLCVFVYFLIYVVVSYYGCMSVYFDKFLSWLLRNLALFCIFAFNLWHYCIFSHILVIYH